MIAHSAVGKLFDIPVVMTTSAQQGIAPATIRDVWFIETTV
jgi:hypothetical protein